MKKIRFLSLFSAGCAISLVTTTVFTTTLAFSNDQETMSVSLDFEKPDFDQISDGTLYPQIEGLQNTVEAGYPSVPVKTVKWAIPSGFKFKEMDISKGLVTTFNGEITKTRSQMPISWIGRTHDQNAQKAFSPLKYEGRYPEADVDVHIEQMNGVPIAIINIYPVSESNRGEKTEISFFENIEISIFLTKDSKNNEISLTSWQRERLQSFVSNQDVLDTYRVAANKKEAYEYLIITVEKFANFTGANNLKDLQNGLAARGLRSKIATISEIYKEAQGIDNPAKIRNFIKKEYKNSKIQYVLLAGDGDASGDGNMIPPRRLWQKVRVYDGQWYYIENHIPADLYYSCLDGDFNGDGDDKWGEPNDGENGKDVDLIAEVVVGRAPLSTTEDLQNFVQKTLWIYKNKVKKDAFLLGELLFAGMNLTGGDYMNQLIGMCTDHNFNTNGYGPEWNIEKFYDEGETEWNGDDALAKINSSYFSMINHLGHSNTNYNMRVFSGDEFKNKTPFVYYTQGCYPGDFTEDRCFIEDLVNQKSGAVVAIANTSYGLAPEDPEPSSTKTPGASQMLHRQYINAIFTDHKIQLGRAHQNSKEDFIGMSTAAEIRWVFWVSNYFGDPSLELKF